MIRPLNRKMFCSSGPSYFQWPWYCCAVWRSLLTSTFWQVLPINLGRGFRNFAPSASCYWVLLQSSYCQCVNALKISMLLFGLAYRYFVFALCVQEEVRGRFPEFLQEKRKTVAVMSSPWSGSDNIIKDFCIF